MQARARTLDQPPDDHAPPKPHELPDLLSAMSEEERADFAPAETEADEREQVRASNRSLLSGLLRPGAANEDGDWEYHGQQVEFTRVVNYDGRDSYYVFTVVHPRTGEEVETRRIDAEDLLTLSNLQEALWRAARCQIMPHRRNGPKWRRVMDAISGAAEDLVPPEPSTSDWAGRLERYLGERLTRDRDEAASRCEPFEEEGQAHVHRESFRPSSAASSGCPSRSARPRTASGTSAARSSPSTTGWPAGMASAASSATTGASPPA